MAHQSLSINLLRQSLCINNSWKLLCINNSWSPKYIFSLSRPTFILAANPLRNQLVYTKIHEILPENFLRKNSFNSHHFLVDLSWAPVVGWGFAPIVLEFPESLVRIYLNIFKSYLLIINSNPYLLIIHSNPCLLLIHSNPCLLLIHSNPCLLLIQAQSDSMTLLIQTQSDSIVINKIEALGLIVN